jgi:Arc/MetJ-type ribon-helix-helix transcriptional regulator
MYVDRMSRGLTTTVRLNAEDAEALRKARADGHEASDLIRRGLRVVAARYYPKKRKPQLRRFPSVDPKLGDESELFGDLDKRDK